jgi:type VI secretion system protein ImpG
MREDLLQYYNQELTFLRRSGADFARRYPKVAARLQLTEPNQCDDPHVERLLEGFAFLAARIHLRLDEDFPQISEALLDVVHPHYTRPVPSLALAQFELDREQGRVTEGHLVARHAELYSRPVAGDRCRFRTCFDTVLWPVEVEQVRWTTPHGLTPPVPASAAVAALSLRLACLSGVAFSQLALQKLRLFLSAEPTLAATLYELLLNNCVQILVRDVAPGAVREPLVLPASVLQPVGFAEDEALLPASGRAFAGYRLLQEYFALPEKFLFLDLAGFDLIRETGFGQQIEIVFLISSFERSERRALLETGVSRQTIRLGCTPVANLFPRTAEPIPLRERREEYLGVADARRRAATGIFAIEDVVAEVRGRPEPLRFEPLYSFRHGIDAAAPRAYWRAVRRPREWHDEEETELYLSFLDLSGRTVHPDQDTATVRLLCYDADLPGRLTLGNRDGDFQMQGAGPVARIVALTRPTRAVQPPLGRPQLWRLISLLSLNYLSLIDSGGEALRELLRLHNFAGSSSGEQQIQGITEVTGRPIHARIASEQGPVFARGNRVEITFDEEQFAGGGAYLFASVLERFLGLCVSLNSFSILAARTRQRRAWLHEWPPRSGWKPIL